MKLAPSRIIADPSISMVAISHMSKETFTITISVATMNQSWGVVSCFLFQQSTGNSDVCCTYKDLTNSVRWRRSARFMILPSATHLHDAIQKHAPAFVLSSLVG